MAHARAIGGICRPRIRDSCQCVLLAVSRWRACGERSKSREAMARWLQRIRGRSLWYRRHQRLCVDCGVHSRERGHEGVGSLATRERGPLQRLVRIGVMDDKQRRRIKQRHIGNSVSHARRFGGSRWPISRRYFATSVAMAYRVFGRVVPKQEVISARDTIRTGVLSIDAREMIERHSCLFSRAVSFSVPRTPQARLLRDDIPQQETRRAPCIWHSFLRAFPAPSPASTHPKTPGRAGRQIPSSQTLRETEI